MLFLSCSSWITMGNLSAISNSLALGKQMVSKGKQEKKNCIFHLQITSHLAQFIKYNLTTGKYQIHQKPKVKFNPDDYVSEQVFYTSADGTKIPMMINYKKGLKRDGKNPTILYSYGGF